MTVESKVALWNQVYRSLGREVRLKDLCDDAYEAEVGSTLLDVCDNDVDMALAVFNHKDNQGGWMCGDVPAYLERQRG